MVRCPFIDVGMRSQHLLHILQEAPLSTLRSTGRCSATDAVSSQSQAEFLAGLFLPTEVSLDSIGHRVGRIKSTPRPTSRCVGSSRLGPSACVFEAVLLLQPGTCRSLLDVPTNTVIRSKTEHNRRYGNRSSLLHIGAAVIPRQVLLPAEQRFSSDLERSHARVRHQVRQAQDYTAIPRRRNTIFRSSQHNAAKR